MQIHILSYGAYLHIADDMFEVKIKVDGQTQKHYLPSQNVTSFWVSPNVAMSSNAVQLAIKNNIDIVFLERNGTPMGRVWHSKLGSTTKIRKLQLEASLGEKGLFYIKKWVGQKLDNQADFIDSLAKRRKKQRAFLLEKRDKILVMSKEVAALSASKVETVAPRLRGLEGTGGRLYFECLSAVLPEQYRFSGRSKRPAADVFNALLNYAYGVLYSRVEKTLIVAGLDPYVGFLHRDDYNHKSMVFDFIEPFRPLVDKVVFQLCSMKKINQEHWESLSGGVGLLKPGKVLLVDGINDFLDAEKVRFDGRMVSRTAIMQAEAYRTAQELLYGESGVIFPEERSF